MENNLLQKASILLTPTAYNDGKMLSVKPEIAFGSELVTNGDFENGSNGWAIAGSNLSISNGKATSTGSNFGAQFRQTILTTNKFYKITFDIVDYTSGAIGLTANYYGEQNIFSSIGTHTAYFTSLNQTELRLYSENFVGSIDNVSVIEDLSGDFTFSRGSAATRVNAQGLVENVQILSSELVSDGNFSQEGSELVTNGDFATDSDWSKSGWVIENGKALSSASSAGNNLYQGSVTSVGGNFKVVITTTIAVGSVVVMLGGGSGGYNVIGEATTSGTFTYYGVSNGTDNRILLQTGNGTLVGSVSIDNISIKEVGQDWTFETGWSVDQANSKVVGDGTSFTYITQSPISIQNKKVKLTFDISDYVSGTFRLSPSDRQDGLDERFSDNGSYEVVYTSTANLFRFQQQAFNGSISNISLKEITDDTDLPRIDYTDGCGSWLLEGQSTNLITHSSDFSQSDWTLSSNAVLTYEANITAPDGSLGVYRLTLPAQSSTFLQFQTGTGSANYTGSIYAKSASVNDEGFNLFFGGTVSSRFTANNDWLRYDYNDNGTQFTIVNDGDTFVTDIYIWGAQLEQQSYATSYIPTNGSIATRLADVATNSGNSTLINSTEGVLYAEIAALENGGDDNRQISISDGTNDNVVILRLDLSDTSITSFIRGNAGSYAIKTITGITKVNNNKIALAWNATNLRIWINGVESGSVAVNDLPIGLSEVNFSKAQNDGDFFYGKVKSLAVYKEALTDEQLQSLTTI